jgi:hypothetical protein
MLRSTRTHNEGDKYASFLDHVSYMSIYMRGPCLFNFEITIKEMYASLYIGH